jgi:porin
VLASDRLNQETSVSQLSDVQPTDWAFEALRSLAERYGCLSGYPDGMFRGQRAVTRYEFAAGLNACFERINELITTTVTDSVSANDLAALQRLLREFGTELADIRGRLDNMEARNAELEANQFSTTTRLTGQVIVGLNDGFQDDASDPHFVFLSRVRLNLETSFTGRDQLLAQLQTGTGGSPDDAADYLQREDASFRDDLIEVGNDLTDQFIRAQGLNRDNFSNLDLSRQSSIEDIRDALAANLRGIAQLSGSSPEAAQAVFDAAADAVETAQGINGFLQSNSGLDYSGSGDRPFLNRLSYTFSPLDDVSLSIFAQGYASDYVDLNRYANNSGQDFSTYGLINNQLLLANDPPGAGAAINWNPGGGFFTLRAVYRAEGGAIATRPANAGNQNGVFGDPYLGVIELGFDPSEDLTINLQYSSGAQNDNQYDVVGANVALDLGSDWGVFGRFGYAFNFPGGIEPTSWSAGFTLNNVLLPGTVIGVGIGQPLIFQDNFIGLFSRTQTNFEAFYKLPLSERFSITPVIQIIANPGNRGDAAIFTGTLRTVFYF